MNRNIVNLALSASLVFAAAGAFVTASAGVSPASAHERDCWPPGHCKHGKKKVKHRDVVVVERPVYVERPPAVVYHPAPVVVAPPPVVVPPPRPAGVHLGVDIPLP